MKPCAVVAAVTALVLTACTVGNPAPHTAAGTPSGSTAGATPEPTDSLSDSTAYFVVNVAGGARVRWTDGNSAVHDEEVGPGLHRYGSDLWQAEHLSVLTVVPLSDDSHASCAIEMGTVDHRRSQQTDEASGPEDVAVCWATSGELTSQTSQQPKVHELVSFTAGNTSHTGNAESFTWADGHFEHLTDLAGQVSRKRDSGGHVTMATISRHSDDRVSCLINVGGTKAATAHAQGLGAIAVCYATIE